MFRFLEVTARWFGAKNPAIVVRVEEEPTPDRVVYVVDGPSKMLTEAELQSLLRSLRKASFGDRMLEILKPWSRSGVRVTSDQAKRIVAVFSFGNDQVDAALLLYSCVNDRHNFHEVVSVVTFRSDQEEVLRRLR